MSSIYRGEKSRSDHLGEIDDDGKVWRGTRSDSDLVGWVDAEGKVLRGNQFAPELVGWVDDEGKVLRGNQFAPELVGWVDGESKVLRGNQFAPELVGEIDPPSRAGGAALLLLLFEPGDDRKSLFGEVLGAAVTAAVSKRAAKARRPREERQSPLTLSDLDAVERAATQMVPARRVVGLVQATLDDVFWANDRKLAMAMWSAESASETPAQLNRKLVTQRRSFHDLRPFVVAIAGDRDYLLSTMEQFEMADLIVVCADAAILRDLDIPIADAAWQTGDKKLDYQYFVELINTKDHRSRSIDEVLATARASQRPSRQLDMKGPQPMSAELLRVGDEQISLGDAKALIAGYCFADLPGRWDTKATKDLPYARDLPDVTWHRWAYRAYDCMPAGDGPELSALDLLIPVGLNVVQGYGTELLPRRSRGPRIRWSNNASSSRTTGRGSRLRISRRRGVTSTTSSSPPTPGDDSSPLSRCCEPNAKLCRLASTATSRSSF